MKRLSLLPLVAFVFAACEQTTDPDRAAELSTNATTNSAAAQCNGNMGVRAYFVPGLGPQDITGLRYKFHVADNNQAGLGLKILFGFIPLYTPGAERTYSLESNLYTLGLIYDHPICTTWPLLGTRVGSEASLRLAIPDYAGLGKTGMKTFAPSVFPLQNYLIDGLPIPKTDAISQLNLNQTTTEVMITRGGLVSDKMGWKCAGPLDADTYRQWDASATVGSTPYNVSFASPASNARFISSGAPIIFRTEFYLYPGLFKVYLWDFQLMRESTESWEPLTQWIVDDQCGDASAYGVRLANFEGQSVMEISNDGPGSFLQVGTIFALSMHVNIDIKPGSDLNPINPRGKGVIPVAILTTDSFDAKTVDPESITFGPDGAAKAHPQGHLEDVDGDGDLDLLLHFRTQGTGIQRGDTEASLWGETFDGAPIEGTDSIATLKN
ncbi:MAG: hypothetical protein JSW46_18155 [Gemmatimonadota bacterium]|nr:MAG: hypothetical protein JSW46_18155 [Gemmatimonadota bacterium]